jgi:hypothetical protein
MTINRNCLTKADAVVIAAIEAGVPSLIEARALVDQFHDMIRKKDEAKLDLWIANAKRSLVSSFATGVLKDRAAVRAAIIQPWSNGQVEAQITKLKLVRRQMYGRAKIDLLEARLLGTARSATLSSNMRQTQSWTLIYTSRRFSSRLLITTMPIEMTASELPKGVETDISTLLSADILALLLHDLSPPFREVTIWAS